MTFTRESEAARCGCNQPDMHDYAPSALQEGVSMVEIGGQVMTEAQFHAARAGLLEGIASEDEAEQLRKVWGRRTPVPSPAPEDERCGCPDSRDCCQAKADLTPITGGIADDTEVVPASDDEREAEIKAMLEGIVASAKKVERKRTAMEIGDACRNEEIRALGSAANVPEGSTNKAHFLGRALGFKLAGGIADRTATKAAP